VMLGPSMRPWRIESWMTSRRPRHQASCAFQLDSTCEAEFTPPLPPNIGPKGGSRSRPFDRPT